MSTLRSLSIVALVAACACLGVQAQSQPQQGPPAQPPPPQNQQPPPPQQPTFRAGVNAVRVDVIVTDREGAPVDTLTDADFEVTEDGKPQKIESARLIHVQTRQEPGGEAPREIRSFDDEATELARDDIRIITLFLDDYHVSRTGAMNVRGWLRQFVQTQVGAYDVVALMYPLTPTSALTFTRDRFALASAIDRFEGRRGDYMVRNDFEANYAMEPPWRIEEIRAEVVGSALKGLCDRLGTLNEGRKSVVVVAEVLALQPSDLQRVIDAANRSNVAIYTLDARGLSVSGGFGAFDALEALAENTNGRAITSRNDLGVALGAVLRDSSAYYLLGYNSDKGADGKFHQIKVRVKRPGLEVRARKGYWAPTPLEAARSFEPPRPDAPPEVTSALAGLAQPQGRLIRTWVGMSRGDGGKTRVTFVWEPIPPPAGSTPADKPARVALAATGSKGEACFNGYVPDGEAPAGAAGAAKPAVAASAATASPAAMVSFDAPPGKLRLRISIEGASAKVLDSDLRDVDVPDLAGPQVTLTTPAIYLARTAREFRLLASDPTAVPTPSREFRRTERLLIRFSAYGRGNSVPALTANLLGRGGQQLSEVTVQASPTSGRDQMIDLPLAGLAPGEYVVEIKAKGESGEATARVAIRVTA